MDQRIKHSKGEDKVQVRHRVTSSIEGFIKDGKEELQKSQKHNKNHYDKAAEPRHLEVGEHVLIVCLTESNKLLMQWKGPYIVESCGSQ